MHLMIVLGMFVCSSFLISVYMFIVSKSLLISSATVIILTGGAIWLFCLDLVRGCFVLSRQKLCVGMVVCISWLHSYLCVWK